MRFLGRLAIYRLFSLLVARHDYNIFTGWSTWSSLFAVRWTGSTRELQFEGLLLHAIFSYGSEIVFGEKIFIWCLDVLLSRSYRVAIHLLGSCLVLARLFTSTSLLYWDSRCTVHVWAALDGLLYGLWLLRAVALRDNSIVILKNFLHYLF